MKVAEGHNLGSTRAVGLLRFRVCVGGGGRETFRCVRFGVFVRLLKSFFYRVFRHRQPSA